MTDRRAASLILVTGSSASGKTTLAAALRDALGFPALSRDALKEVLLDDLGAADRAASRRLGSTSWELFYAVLGELAGRVPLIAEANFSRGRAEPRLLPLVSQFRAVVLHCHADEDTIQQRVFARTDSPERHPGHFDVVAWPELAAARERGEHLPLGLTCPTLAVDTTDGYRPGLEEIIAWIDAAIGPVIRT